MLPVLEARSPCGTGSFEASSPKFEVPDMVKATTAAETSLVPHIEVLRPLVPLRQCPWSTADDEQRGPAPLADPDNGGYVAGVSPALAACATGESPTAQLRRNAAALDLACLRRVQRIKDERSV